jgi:autotransporter-associated beta strand protein
LVLLILAAAAPLRAATMYWTNTTVGDFTNAANWRTGLPSAGDSGAFSNQGTYTVNFTVSTSVSNLLFNVQSNAAGANITFNLGGNTLTVDRATDANSASGTNFYTISNGTLLATNLSSTSISLVANNAGTSFTRLTVGSGGRLVATNGSSSVAVAGTAGSRAELDLLDGSYGLMRFLRVGSGNVGSIGTVVQSGGSNEFGAGGVSIANGNNSTGYYYVVGADAVLNSANVAITLGGGTSSYGVLAVSNGTVLARLLTMGSGSGSTGRLVVAGGTVLLGGGGSGNSGLQTVGGAFSDILLSGGTLGNIDGSNWVASMSMAITNTGVGAIRFAPSSTNSITLNGALVGNGSLIKGGSGTLILSGTNTFSGNTVLQDGRLQLMNRVALQSSTLVMTNAASLGFSTTRTNGLGGLSGTTSFGLTNSSGLSLALYVGGNGANTEYSGVLSGSGGLIKEGAGTLNLSGNNSYTGTTTVSGGTLRVNGVYGGGALFSVASNATLAGTGSLAHVTLSDGARLAPGNSVGTLTVSNLAFSGASLFDFELGATNASDLVRALGTLTLAQANFSNFTFATNSGFGAGTYTLIDAAAHIGSFTAATNTDLYGYVGVLALGGADGNDLVLSLASAIPEPCAVALLACAGGLALFLRSRRSSRVR